MTDRIKFFYDEQCTQEITEYYDLGKLPVGEVAFHPFYYRNEGVITIIDVSVKAEVNRSDVEVKVGGSNPNRLQPLAKFKGVLQVEALDDFNFEVKGVDIKLVVDGTVES